jgi:hypothetical protein
MVYVAPSGTVVAVVLGEKRSTRFTESRITLWVGDDRNDSLVQEPP